MHRNKRQLSRLAPFLALSKLDKTGGVNWWCMVYSIIGAYYIYIGSIIWFEIALKNITFVTPLDLFMGNSHFENDPTQIRKKMKFRLVSRMTIGAEVFVTS